MRKRSQRLWLIGAATALVGGAVALGVFGLKDAVAFFQSPSDIAEKGSANLNRNVKVGGLVEVGSEKHEQGGKVFVFRITDGKNAIPVVFDGIPPDMVKEGKGVVAEGKIDETGTLIASRVLAKHDENYMPKEAYDALKRAAEKDGGDSAYVKEPVT